MFFNLPEKPSKYWQTCLTDFCQNLDCRSQIRPHCILWLVVDPMIYQVVVMIDDSRVPSCCRSFMYSVNKNLSWVFQTNPNIKSPNLMKHQIGSPISKFLWNNQKRSPKKKHCFESRIPKWTAAWITFTPGHRQKSVAENFMFPPFGGKSGQISS